MPLVSERIPSLKFGDKFELLRNSIFLIYLNYGTLIYRFEFRYAFFLCKNLFSRLQVFFLVVDTNSVTVLFFDILKHPYLGKLIFVCSISLGMFEQVAGTRRFGTHSTRVGSQDRCQ
jgi:hypothetical protein